MANDTYSVAGLLIGAGRPAPPSSSLPAWRTAMAANTWAVVPGNTMADVDPANDPVLNPQYPSAAIWRASLGQPAVVEAWGGATLDEDTDNVYVWGGGHLDYAGNEMYRVSLSSEAPTWQMISEPSGARVSDPPATLLTSTTSPAADGYYYDGQLRSQHTYNKLMYLPGRGVANNSNGGGYDTGQYGDRSAWLFYVEADSWSRITSAQTGSYSDHAGCYDSLRDRIWSFSPAEETIRYADVGGTLPTAYEQTNPTGYGPQVNQWYVCANYIESQDLIVVAGGHSEFPENSDIRIFDPAANTWHKPALTGADITGIIFNWAFANPHWVESEGALFMWDNQAGYEAKLVKLTPTGNLKTDPWVKSIVTPSGGDTPSTRQINGTYGRFKYSPRSNGFYLINRQNGPIYFYALS